MRVPSTRPVGDPPTNRKVTPRTEELLPGSRIAEIIDEEVANGAAAGWMPCSGCHETNEGAETGLYPYSKAFGCYVGAGCSECGGLGVVWHCWDGQALAAMQSDLAALYAGHPREGGDPGQLEAPAVDYFGELVIRARIAAAKASRKFPQPNYVTLKIAEEAGEVVRGAVHFAEGRMQWEEVEGEIVQLLAMLIRFVTEGDEINGVVPPTRTPPAPVWPMADRPPPNSKFRRSHHD